MMPSKKFDSLLDVVLARTRENRLDWQETPDVRAFKTLFRHGALVIRHGSSWTEDGEEIPWAAVEILNEQGLVAESHSATAQEPAYERIFDLWKLAQSRARQSDRLLDEILQELK